MKKSMLRIVSMMAAVIAVPAWSATPAKVTFEHATSPDDANVFPSITPASRSDAGNLATFRLIKGQGDGNSAGVDVLNDGQLPDSPDAPRSNYFVTGPEASRLLVELAKPRELKEIRTYSRHPGGRGPQRYSVYTRENLAKAKLTQLEVDPQEPGSGWQLLAEVDTRKIGHSAATTAAAIAPGGEKETLGEHRYLLFAIEKGEPADPFGNTFYSEIDLDDGSEHSPPPLPEGRSVVVIDDVYRIEFDTTETPQLTQWVNDVLKPTCTDWYPKIVNQFPTEGYRAPQQFKVVFEAGMNGVAYTAGTRVVCAEGWFANNLDGEAAGAVVHELVHVVQQYSRRPHAAPSWVVEGIADYVRWFQYEPEELRPNVNFDRANYNDSYRTTGAFFNFLAQEYGEQLPTKLNDICRRGEYTDEVWKQLTDKPVEELWKDFARSMQGQ